MKTTSGLKIWSLILIFSLGTTTVNAQKSTVEPLSKLQKVTVFNDRAMITKEALFQAKKGENVLLISGITANLINESVQVSLMGQQDLVISEVAVEETWLKKPDQPDLRKLQSDLNNLNNLINESTNQISVITSESDFLRKVNPFPQNLKVTTTDMEAHARFLEKSLSANYERIATIETRLKKLAEEKTALENELGNLKSDKNKSKTIVIHLVSSNDKGNAKIAFTYLTANAGWSSQYEAKGDFNGSSIDLNYFASIRQFTGEDWIDANIEISTAKPFVYGNIPELPAWYLDVNLPRMFKSKSLTLMERQNAPLAMAPADAAPVPDTQFEESGVREENTSFTFTLPRRVTVVSDGLPHRISIGRNTKSAEFSWFTIPKIVQNAFLKASVKNPFSFPLLPGPISVFFDSKLVGTAYVTAPVVSDGELNLSLGIDEGIKIERKLLKRYTDYAGLLSKETAVWFEYAIEVTNGKNREITIDLNDQFPVSRNEKIRVVQQVPKAGDATINEEGKITWKVTLAGGAKKTFPVKFSVVYPKELNVSGL